MRSAFCIILHHLASSCITQTSYLSPISHIIYVEKKFPCGEFSAFHVWRLQGNKKILYMWRNFRCLPMTDVEKPEILHIWQVCCVEKVTIYAKFMLFSWKIQKFSLWRKNDKYQVCLYMDLKFPHHFHTVKVHHKDEVILTPSDGESRQFYDSCAVRQVIF